MSYVKPFGKRATLLAAVLCVLSIALGVSLWAAVPVAPRAEATAEIPAAFTVGGKSQAQYVTNGALGLNGLQVTLAQRETFTYNTLLSLAELERGTPVLKVHVAPSIVGVQDYKRLFITLTDSRNPDIFITFQYRNWENESKCIISAMANGQDFSSIERGTNKIFHGKNEWHTPCMYAFGGTYAGGRTHTQRPITVWYSNAEKTAYYDAQYRTSNALTPEAAGDKLKLADFDDPLFFSNVWSGFKSDHVKLSISAEEYIDTKATFVITEIAGNTDLRAEKVSETTPPVITVETPWSATVPNAKVGGTFPVFAASAFDAQFGACAVSSKVEFAATSSGARSAVAVSNGRFSTAAAGYYFITYTAVDPLGNRESQTITVQAVESVAAPTVTVDTAAGVAEAGAWVSVRNVPEAASYPETTEFTVKATLGATEVLFTEGKDGKLGFRPMQTGVWTVTYTATDICGQSVGKSYTLTVSAGSQPVFTTEPTLPDIMISGDRYYLPQVEATSFASGTAQAVATTVVVKDAAGERTVKADETYIPRVAKNGDSVKIAYCAGESKLEKEIPCVLAFEASGNRMRLKIENYLSGSGFAIEKSDFSSKITATSADAGWVFANPFLLSRLSVQLTTLPEQSDFSALRFTVYDAENPMRTVSCRIVQERTQDGNFYTEKSYLITGDKNAPAVKSPLGSLFTPYAPSTAVTVSYADGRWNYGGSWSLPIETWDDGTPFDGFTGDKAYIGVAFEDAVPQRAAYTLTAVNGQLISANPYDRTAPVIVMQGKYGGMCAMGETATVQKALAADALDSMISFGVTVTAPDQTVAVATDGTKLENVSPARVYEFTPEQYGSYTVTYLAFDSFGNKQQFVYTIIVLDDIAPEIKFASTPAASGKVGTAFQIPKIVVTDNVSKAENITVSEYVFSPRGHMTMLTGESNGFIPKQTGVYTVYVFAFDEAGNVALLTYTVTVE